MNEGLRLLANAGLFQVAWFSCVLGAKQPALLLIAVACIATHLLWLSSRHNEWQLLLIMAGCGWLLDSALLQLGIFSFSQAHRLLPLWLALLWLAFVTTIAHSLRWSAKPWWRASLLGAIGGPLSYLGGAQLADVQFPLGILPSLLLLALIWAALLPALHWIAQRPHT